MPSPACRAGHAGETLHAGDTRTGGVMPMGDELHDDLHFVERDDDGELGGFEDPGFADDEEEDDEEDGYSGGIRGNADSLFDNPDEDDDDEALGFVGGEEDD